MAATQEHLSRMPLVLLKKKNSSAYVTVYYLNRDNPVPNCPNSYAPLNAGDPAFNEPMAYDSSYPLISRLLQYAQGQTLAEF